MTKQDIIARMDAIKSIPRHLREFEEVCELRSLGAKLAAITTREAARKEA